MKQKDQQANIKENRPHDMNARIIIRMSRPPPRIVPEIREKLELLVSHLIFCYFRISGNKTRTELKIMD